MNFTKLLIMYCVNYSFVNASKCKYYTVKKLILLVLLIIMAQ